MIMVTADQPGLFRCFKHSCSGKDRSSQKPSRNLVALLESLVSPDLCVFPSFLHDGWLCINLCFSNPSKSTRQPYYKVFIKGKTINELPMKTVRFFDRILINEEPAFRI